MTVNPIYILGAGRSGTSLLAKLMDGYLEKTCVLYEPLIFYTIRLNMGYRVRIKPSEQELLLNSLFNNNREKDPYLGLALCHVYNALNNRKMKIRELVTKIYTSYADARACVTCCDKTPANLLYLDLLDQFCGDSKIIQIVRHPCAVLASRFRVNQNYNLWFGNRKIGNRLRAIVLAYKQMLNLVNFKQGKHRVITIRYEDLVSDPMTMMKHLAEFMEDRLLDEPKPTPWLKMLKDSYAFKLLNAAPTPIHVDRWKSEIDEETISLVETLLKDYYIQYGYDITMKSPYKNLSLIRKIQKESSRIGAFRRYYKRHIKYRIKAVLLHLMPRLLRLLSKEDYAVNQNEWEQRLKNAKIEIKMLEQKMGIDG